MLDAACWLNYEFAAHSLTFILTLGWSLRVAGRNHLPPAGPVLLIANHQSFLDPPAIGLACRRHIAYLARKTLFDNPLFGGMIRGYNAIPVDQDGMAKDGLRAILEKLEAGWPVLVFPEGARTEDGKIHELQPGISLVIKRARCPIVPVGIAGAYAAWPKGTMLPVPSPLFFPATNRTLAISIGKPRAAASVADLPREEMLKVMAADMAAEWENAERLRRKPRHDMKQ